MVRSDLIMVLTVESSSHTPPEMVGRLVTGEERRSGEVRDNWSSNGHIEIGASARAKVIWHLMYEFEMPATWTGLYFSGTYVWGHFQRGLHLKGSARSQQ